MKFVTSVTILCCSLVGSILTERRTQPHIVLLVADDLGWNDVGFHGSNQIPTPNIDALAYSGVILNRHYVLPICTPSRTALLTGTNAIRQGMQGYPLKGGEPRGVPVQTPLLPEYLKQLNYSTHLVGKWHLGFMTPRHIPTNRGFDSFFGYYNGYVEYFKHGYNQSMSSATKGTETFLYGFDLHENLNDLAYTEYEGKYLTRVLTDHAVNLIQQHQDDSPLFLMLSHLAVHTGIDQGSGLEVPEDMNVDELFPHIAEYERRCFAGILTELDTSVGKIVQALWSAGILEDTIIVFMADNGAQSVSVDLQPNWGSNFPLRGGKFSLYDGGIRGDAFIWNPKLPSGKVSNNFMHITDWLPTLISAAGGDPSKLPAHIDGKNKWDELQNSSATSNRSILVNIDEAEGAEAVIVDSRWKVVRGGMRKYASYDGLVGKVFENSKYNESRVKNSMVGSVMTDLGYTVLDDIIPLRLQATVNCGHNLTCDRSNKQFGIVKPSTDFLCTDFCVFELISDPCECRPIVNDVVMKMGIEILESFRKELVPQTNKAVDPKSNPDLWGGVWKPWCLSGGTTPCGEPFIVLAVLSRTLLDRWSH